MVNFIEFHPYWSLLFAFGFNMGVALWILYITRNDANPPTFGGDFTAYHRAVDKEQHD